MYASFAPATWALLAYLFGALALCLLMLGLGRVLGGRSHGRAKNLPFESGVDSTGSSRLRFSVKYALVAMLFVIFGIEMPFLYLWAVSLRENGWAGFVEATKTLPLGTAYTIWVGIGAVGAFALGILLFGESPSPLRLLAVGLIVAGIVILKLATRQG